MAQAQQLHHRPDLRERDPQGAPRRLPRRDRAGDPAHHRRDQELHPAAAPATPTSRIVEIGGTVGDIESLPFLEAIRQMSIELGRDNVCFIHLTLVPFIAAAGEMKTKPTQHSVQGAARDRHPARRRCCAAPTGRCPTTSARKIALFTNVPSEAVISALGRRHHLQDSAHAARAGARRASSATSCSCTRRRPTCRAGTSWSTRSSIPQHEVHIAMVGKYVDLTDSYKSLNEALRHAGIHNHAPGQDPLRRLRRRSSATASAACADMDAILVPGGFGKRGVEGKIAAVALRAREQHPVPRHLPRHAARGRSSTRATWRAWPTPTAPSSIPTRRIR